LAGTGGPTRINNEDRHGGDHREPDHVGTITATQIASVPVDPNGDSGWLKLCRASSKWLKL